MSEIMQFLDAYLGLAVFLFTVTNFFYLGIQVKIDGIIEGLKDRKAMALIIVWSWVLGPALAYLITGVLPMAEPYVIGLLLSSLAPVTPFLPLTVEKARGDMNFAGALVPLVMVGTVILMPLMGPLMITGVEVTAWSLAKPLLLSVFLPLVIGVAFRHYAETAATRIRQAANVIAKITTVTVGVWVLVVYARLLIDSAGTFALLAVALFTVLIALISYLVGFGLKQSQRSVISLAMLTRNGGPVLISALAIPNVDDRIVTLVVWVNLAGFILAPIAARIFGKRAGKTVAGSTA
ncbi:MAG: bile acid:sodium symporter family protein [Planctomycetota bacterium]|jgi:BASS family bile acid:Na+ symporter